MSSQIKNEALVITKARISALLIKVRDPADDASYFALIEELVPFNYEHGEDDIYSFAEEVLQS